MHPQRKQREMTGVQLSFPRPLFLDQDPIPGNGAEGRSFQLILPNLDNPSQSPKA